MEQEKQVSHYVKSYNGNPPGMAILMGAEVPGKMQHAACGAGKRKLQALAVSSNYCMQQVIGHHFLTD
jgi:hypothetical protein